MSAYLTLLMLLLHYITIFDIRSKSSDRAGPVNTVDYGILTWLRSRIMSWTPSRRFDKAMEKSVLILGDLNVVTGIGILLAGYSQLKCGISAYHWQIMVFISWFASFSFISAMTFLQGYLRVNNTMRLIRMTFMVIFVGLLIIALLPTGSKMWLNGYPDDTEGYYPSMNAYCFFLELRMPAKFHRGANFWTMIFSVLLIFGSHFHCGIRLFDPTAGSSRKILRTIPGTKFKQLLYSMERRGGASYTLHALGWRIIYLLAYAIFTFARATYDICESMFAEILWLSFAMAWGTIKV
ncbi:Vanillyl-alcohol oxidase [Pyrenophora seminiperda CCB06]|uniref:Vanillyl-alcohol oxidase n=1 Tax=Pyrenophora seminiperda CCB06 TaxID=1302712 RepID=A0A3M7MFV3_9PLEO|nr:Vanillyl-alcohol oxidase [Pyrenophora seminiperda CCB06]